MKLHEFQEMVRKEREAVRLTNLEKIAKITNNRKEKENN